MGQNMRINNTRFLGFVAGVLFLSLAACRPHAPNPSEHRVGLVLPLPHASMDAIVAGFSETIYQEFPHAKIEVSNAQNDLNLERAIFQKLKAGGHDLVVPVGLQATQMALSSLDEQPILSLAANLTETDRQDMKHCHLAVLRDEIPAERLLGWLEKAYPQVKTWMIIHSPGDKEFNEVKALQATAEKHGLVIESRMIQAVSELYTMAEHLPPSTQGILVLKDHLIVSGISVLAQAAEKRQLPLVASDQGSVLSGAQLALGVHERTIGVEGAKLAIQILKGVSPCSIPVQGLREEDFTVFINVQALKRAQRTEQQIHDLEAVAKQMKLNVEHAH